MTGAARINASEGGNENMNQRVHAILVGVILVLACCAYAEPIQDVAFYQETHEAYPMPAEVAEGFRAIAIDANEVLWAATSSGVWSYVDGSWVRAAGAIDGAAFDVAIDSEGTVWAAAWNGLYRFVDGAFSRVQEVEGPIAVLCATSNGILSAGPDGIWTRESDSWIKKTGNWPSSIRGVTMGADGTLWIATWLGLYNHSESGDRYYHDPDEILTGALSGIALDSEGRIWTGGLGGVEVFRNGQSERRFTTGDGLPTAEVQCLAFGSDGRLWVGTSLGVARYDGTAWSLRHGRRWLLSDDVRDVAFGPDGTAWIATSAGVSAIRTRAMTMAEKASELLEKGEARHVREPGLVEKCRLNVPGDLSSWEPVDDDNDGQYTAMHLAAESYRYAVTKDPDAREKAKRAYHALEFLQTATGTEGFVARSVIPVSWNRMADANEEISEERAAVGRVEDPRWKPVQQRWRPTADGKWLWKGDTSSDEITGHFYGYYIYYTLAADDAEKERVSALVRHIMDHIIAGGLNLNDIDGTHTRWGVWAPEKLNGDPNWRAERGINAQEILSFLKATFVITGDAKYEEHYRRLIDKHGYGEHARRSKTYAPSERTHIDDELLALTYNVLLEQEKDPGLLAIYKESLDWWYKGLAQDQSPFFNFLYGGLGGDEFGLDEGIAYLRDAPLDLIDWTDNSQREDVRLVRAPEIEPLQTDRLMPPSERAVMRWDRSPWKAVGGSDGTNEQSPTAWLLPYWMGRYYGFIAAR
jgi:hypothetical protein